MGTWNRLTAVRGVREGDTGWNKVKRLGKEHTCITQRHRRQCGDGQRQGAGTGWRWARGQRGTAVTVSIIKIKGKKTRDNCWQGHG